MGTLLQSLVDEAIARTPPSDRVVVRIRPGVYRLRTPLRISRGGLRLLVSRNAHMVAKETLSSFLEIEPGIRDVTMRGGRWSGAGFVFEDASSLHIEDTVVESPSGDAIRLRAVRDFAFRNLRLSPQAPGHAAIRIGAFCRDGTLSGIHASIPDSGAALSIDADAADSAEERDHGPVERIRVRHLRAEGPGTAVVLRSTRSTIRIVHGAGLDARRSGTAIEAVSSDIPPISGNIDDVQFDRISPPPPSRGHFFRLAAHAYGLRLRGRGVAVDHNDRHPRANSTAPRFRTHLLAEPGEFLVTSPFGPRIHPVTGEVGAPHLGIDGALWDGRSLVETDVCAWADGSVLEATDSDGPAGTHVVIDHGNGLVTRYFHLEQGSLRVAAGDRVRLGTPLAHMGRTGRATGEHLHFQMERDGVPFDPLLLLIPGCVPAPVRVK